MTPRIDPRELFDIPDPFQGDRATPEPFDEGALPAARTRAEVQARRSAAIAAVIAVYAAYLAICGVRRPLAFDLLGFGVALPVLTSALTLVVFKKCSSHRSTIQATIVMGAAVFLLMTALTEAPSFDSADGFPFCIPQEIVLIAASAALTLASMRNAFVSSVRLRTAALGLASGLAASAVVRLHCPNDEFWHLLLGHGGPILGASLVIAAWGPRYLRA